MESVITHACTCDNNEQNKFLPHHPCAYTWNLLPLFFSIALNVPLFMFLPTFSLQDFWSITLIITLLIMSPGPAFAVTVENSLHYGRKGGLQTACGIMLGDLTHIVLNLLGITVLITQFPAAMYFVKICGAFYFMYLGVQLFIKTFENFSLKEQSTSKPQTRPPFQKGLYVGLLNPKAGIFYLNFFAVMLPPSLTNLHRIALGGWILIIVFVWFGCVATFLNYGKIRDHFLTYHPWIQRVCGLALFYFGTKIILEN